MKLPVIPMCYYFMVICFTHVCSVQMIVRSQKSVSKAGSQQDHQKRSTNM